MAPIQSYCDFVRDLPLNNLHRRYHDTRYGFPIANDDELFGRLILEIFQAGLSWEIILRKQENFRVAFNNFAIEKIAAYGQEERDRLLTDAGIVRNRKKIEATIANAQVVIQLQTTYGSFKSWLDSQGQRSLPEWTTLFKQHFTFIGSEIVREFLMSTGYLPGAHQPNCPLFNSQHSLNIHS